MKRRPAGSGETAVRASAPSVRAHLRIGTAGWSIPRACADAFPGPGSHLERYARVLPCAEINATFYRSPRPSTYGRWTISVPGDFHFSVKAPKAITHEAGLSCTSAQLEAFLNEACSLGPRLGPILFQLPPKLAFDPAVAERFFTSLRELYPGPAVVEPRHASWFEPRPDALLKQMRIARVAADPARTPTSAGPGGDPGLLYYRLHGSPRTYYSSYSAQFLEGLAEEFVRHSATRSPEIWCIFDNTASGAAAANALALLDLAQQKGGQRDEINPGRR